jgi:hypothetical protein
MRKRFFLVGYGLWYYSSIVYGLRQAQLVSVPTNCIRLNANAQTLLTDEVPTGMMFVELRRTRILTEGNSQFYIFF